MLSAFNRRCDRVLNGLLAALMAAMVLIVTWQVASRYLLRAPSSFTEEAARFLLIWIGLLGAARAYRAGQHLGLELFTDRLGPAAQRLAARVADACVLTFALLVMVVGGSALVHLTWILDQRSPAMNLPMGAVYSVIPLGGLLLCAFSAERLFAPEPKRSETP
ncbi:MAG: C4-dicarboxylate ABC transporter permease [Gammaproteobacteria bacterium]|nr:MAG: C4-dicarboxylate ABC transporter permease [Gammaproteobacteria bacterium]